MAKDNGVTILTIPPHCPHTFQPLDVGVLLPMKNSYNAEMDNWMVRHSGQTVSIYDISAFVAAAFDKAIRPENIKSGFRKKGIFPFDNQIFAEDGFSLLL